MNQFQTIFLIGILLLFSNFVHGEQDSKAKSSSNSIQPEGENVEEKETGGDTTKPERNSNKPLNNWLGFSVDITLQVQDIENIIETLRETAKEFDGYPHSWQSNFLELRFPRQKYLPALDNLKKSGKVLVEKVRSFDYRQEILNIESTIQTQREQRNRFLKLISQAKTAKDLALLQTELHVLTTELEFQMGRQRVVMNQMNWTPVRIQLQYFSNNVPAPSPSMMDNFYWIQELGVERLMSLKKYEDYY